MSSQPSWNITIEGAHRVGKDTLCEALMDATDWRHQVSVRGVISNYAFAQLMGRPPVDIVQAGLDFNRNPRSLLILLPLTDSEDYQSEFSAKFPQAKYTNKQLDDLIFEGARRFGCRLVYKLQPRIDFEYHIQQIKELLV